MTLPERFVEFVKQENLFSPQDVLLLAVSGGVDSVVLCDLCYRAGYDFFIAHCNFQLRGAESDRDETLVRALAEKYQKEILVKRMATQQYASEQKVSIQVAAREMRYAWFKEIASQRSHAGVIETGRKHPPSRFYILTAHHLGDSVETLLMNFFKGTGIAGLHGILQKQGILVRPLLFAKKDEIIQFAKDNQLIWAEDSSNESDKYSRNYLRHRVIPPLTEMYPNLIDNLSANISRFKDIEQLYDQAIDLHLKKLIEIKGNEIHIPVLKLKKAIPLATILYELVKAYHFSSSQVPEIIHLLDSDSSKFVQSSTHRIIKNRQWIIIAPNDSRQSGHIIIGSPGKWAIAGGELIIEVEAVADAPGQEEASRIAAHIANLDAEKVPFPLLMRRWKQGDYFYPLGMSKKKKIGRFFIDNKLSKTAKENAWVLEADKKIIWVVGMRIDDRFKISPKTRIALHIEMRVTQLI